LKSTWKKNSPKGRKSSVLKPRGKKEKPWGGTSTVNDWENTKKEKRGGEEKYQGQG